MYKTTFALTLALALGFIACQKEEPTTTDPLSDLNLPETPYD